VKRWLLVALGGIGGASKCLFHRLARGRPTECFSRSGQQGVIDLDRGAPLHAYILARPDVHKRVSPARTTFVNFDSRVGPAERAATRANLRLRDPK